jgi:hypothetical protein
LEAVNRCNEQMIELLDFDPSVFAEVCIAPKTSDQPLQYRKTESPLNLGKPAKSRSHSRAMLDIRSQASDEEAGLNAGIKSGWIEAKSTAYPKVSRFDSLLDFATQVTATRTK